MASPPDRAAQQRVEGRRGMWTGLDQASVMSMELLAAIFVWAGIGWLLDRWLGTEPWLLVLGALVGNGAGLYLIWLRGERLNAAEENRRVQGASGGR